MNKNKDGKKLFWVKKKILWLKNLDKQVGI